MKTLLILLTLGVIGWCADLRTNHFHPAYVEARFEGLKTAATVDTQNWPEAAIILMLLVLACFIMAPFFFQDNQKR
ncbi:hypothetical protein [Larkinella soli]|uniref:hypothetical protein n=1 Tax=Larkinella soli TaxID=1770527 RepID=UPI000FFB4E61|nr:hypothetical protein [Larkinella soli]